MPRAARRDRRPPAAHRRDRRPGPARGAAGLQRRHRAGARRDVRQRHPRHGPRAGRQDRRRRPRLRADRPRHLDEPPHLERHPARRRRGAGGHRRGDGGRAGERLLRRAPARPPRLPQPGDGLLHLQQRRHRGPLCAGAPWPQARRDRGLRRAPRQRHRGHPGRRRAGADGRHLPEPVLPGQRLSAAGGQHGQPADPGLYQGRRHPQEDRAGMAAAAAGIQARDDLHQRRLRRPPRGRPGPAGPGGSGLHLDDAEIKAIAKKYAKGRIVSSLEGGYNLDALGRSVEAHVRALADI